MSVSWKESFDAIVSQLVTSESVEDARLILVDICCLLQPIVNECLADSRVKLAGKLRKRLHRLLNLVKPIPELAARQWQNTPRTVLTIEVLLSKLVAWIISVTLIAANIEEREKRPSIVFHLFRTLDGNPGQMLDAILNVSGDGSGNIHFKIIRKIIKSCASNLTAINLLKSVVLVKRFLASTTTDRANDVEECLRRLPIDGALISDTAQLIHAKYGKMFSIDSSNNLEAFVVRLLAKLNRTKHQTKLMEIWYGDAERELSFITSRSALRTIWEQEKSWKCAAETEEENCSPGSDSFVTASVTAPVDLELSINHPSEKKVESEIESSVCHAIVNTNDSVQPVAWDRKRKISTKKRSHEELNSAELSTDIKTTTSRCKKNKHIDVDDKSSWSTTNQSRKSESMDNTCSVLIVENTQSGYIFSNGVVSKKRKRNLELYDSSNMDVGSFTTKSNSDLTIEIGKRKSKKCAKKRAENVELPIPWLTKSNDETLDCSTNLNDHTFDYHSRNHESVITIDEETVNSHFKENSIKVDVDISFADKKVRKVASEMDENANRITEMESNVTKIRAPVSILKKSSIDTPSPENLHSRLETVESKCLVEQIPMGLKKRVSFHPETSNSKWEMIAPKSSSDQCPQMCRVMRILSKFSVRREMFKNWHSIRRSKRRLLRDDCVGIDYSLKVTPLAGSRSTNTAHDVEGLRKTSKRKKRRVSFDPNVRIKVIPSEAEDTGHQSLTTPRNPTPGSKLARRRELLRQWQSELRDESQSAPSHQPKVSPLSGTDDSRKHISDQSTRDEEQPDWQEQAVSKLDCVQQEKQAASFTVVKCRPTTKSNKKLNDSASTTKKQPLSLAVVGSKSDCTIETSTEISPSNLDTISLEQDFFDSDEIKVRRSEPRNSFSPDVPAFPKDPSSCEEDLENKEGSGCGSNEPPIIHLDTDVTDVDSVKNISYAISEESMTREVFSLPANHEPETKHSGQSQTGMTLKGRVKVSVTQPTDVRMDETSELMTTSDQRLLENDVDLDGSAVSVLSTEQAGATGEKNSGPTITKSLSAPGKIFESQPDSSNLVDHVVAPASSEQVAGAEFASLTSYLKLVPTSNVSDPVTDSEVRISSNKTLVSSTELNTEADCLAADSQSIRASLSDGSAVCDVSSCADSFPVNVLLPQESLDSDSLLDLNVAASEESDSNFPVHNDGFSEAVAVSHILCSEIDKHSASNTDREGGSFGKTSNLLEKGADKSAEPTSKIESGICEILEESSTEKIDGGFSSNDGGDVALPDGSNDVALPDGSNDVALPDGSNDVALPDGSNDVALPDGSNDVALPDGSNDVALPDGSADVALPDGSNDVALPDGSDDVALPVPNGSFTTDRSANVAKQNGDLFGDAGNTDSNNKLPKISSPSEIDVSTLKKAALMKQVFVSLERLDIDNGTSVSPSDVNPGSSASECSVMLAQDGTSHIDRALTLATSDTANTVIIENSNRDNIDEKSNVDHALEDQSSLNFGVDAASDLDLQQNDLQSDCSDIFSNVSTLCTTRGLNRASQSLVPIGTSGSIVTRSLKRCYASGTPPRASFDSDGTVNVAPSSTLTPRRSLRVKALQEKAASAAKVEPASVSKSTTRPTNTAKRSFRARSTYKHDAVVQDGNLEDCQAANQDAAECVANKVVPRKICLEDAEYSNLPDLSQKQSQLPLTSNHPLSGCSDSSASNSEIKESATRASNSESKESARQTVDSVTKKTAPHTPKSGNKTSVTPGSETEKTDLYTSNPNSETKKSAAPDSEIKKIALQTTNSETKKSGRLIKLTGAPDLEGYIGPPEMVVPLSSRISTAGTEDEDNESVSDQSVIEVQHVTKSVSMLNVACCTSGSSSTVDPVSRLRSRPSPSTTGSSIESMTMTSSHSRIPSLDQSARLTKRSISTEVPGRTTASCSGVSKRKALHRNLLSSDEEDESSNYISDSAIKDPEWSAGSSSQISDSVIEVSERSSANCELSSQDRGSSDQDKVSGSSVTRRPAGARSSVRSGVRRRLTQIPSDSDSTIVLDKDLFDKDDDDSSSSDDWQQLRIRTNTKKAAAELADYSNDSESNSDFKDERATMQRSSRRTEFILWESQESGTPGASRAKLQPPPRQEFPEVINHRKGQLPTRRSSRIQADAERRKSQ